MHRIHRKLTLNKSTEINQLLENKTSFSLNIKKERNENEINERLLRPKSVNRDAVRRVASASAKKETTGILTQRNSSKSIGRQLQICMDRGHGDSTGSISMGANLYGSGTQGLNALNFNGRCSSEFIIKFKRS